MNSIIPLRGHGPLFHYSKRFLTTSLFIVLYTTFILIGCQSGNALDQPPQIRYGEDACDECHMLINEARFASAIVTSQAQTRRFDDIGCMLIYLNKHQEDVVYFWVTDFNSQKWLDAENAAFVQSDNIQTPMGFGIIAAANKNAAKKMVGEDTQAKIMDFSGLRKIKIY